VWVVDQRKAHSSRPTLARGIVGAQQHCPINSRCVGWLRLRQPRPPSCRAVHRILVISVWRKYPSRPTDDLRP